MEELKLLALYGSGMLDNIFSNNFFMSVFFTYELKIVAFDEDFEAELSENHEARFEVSMLAQSPDREFTEVNLETWGTRHILPS